MMKKFQKSFLLTIRNLGVGYQREDMLRLMRIPKILLDENVLKNSVLKPSFGVNNLGSTVTIGLASGHTDIGLGYILRGRHENPYAFDTQEFHSIEWFLLDEIPYSRSDPQMFRFIEKLRGLI